MSNLHIQYGCGLCAPTNWINFDVSPTLRLQKLPLIGPYFRKGGFPIFPANVLYGDIVKGLPITSQSCSAVYCSHVLEHLALDDLRVALQNTYSYLHEDGIFRFVVPDLEWLIQEYIQSSLPNAALIFMESSGLGKMYRDKGVRGILRSWLGNSAHLWMWDFKAIACELRKTGFRNVRIATYNDSQDLRFCEVEDFGRWKHCLGVECIR